MSYEIKTSVYDKFLQLRTVMIEATGLSWKDKEFREAFIEDPKGTMEKAFGYKFPFDIDFTIDTEKVDKWQPEKTGGWVGPNNTLTMVLPPDPGEEQRAVALADYNAHHLTMFGN